MSGFSRTNTSSTKGGRYVRFLHRLSGLRKSFDDSLAVLPSSSSVSCSRFAASLRLWALCYARRTQPHCDSTAAPEGNEVASSDRTFTSEERIHLIPSTPANPRPYLFPFFPSPSYTLALLFAIVLCVLPHPRFGSAAAELFRESSAAAQAAHHARTRSLSATGRGRPGHRRLGDAGIGRRARRIPDGQRDVAKRVQGLRPSAPHRRPASPTTTSMRSTLTGLSPGTIYQYDLRVAGVD